MELLNGHQFLPKLSKNVNFRKIEGKFKNFVEIGGNMQRLGGDGRLLYVPESFQTASDYIGIAM